MLLCGLVLLLSSMQDEGIGVRRDRPLTDSEVEQNDAAIVLEETVQIKIAVVQGTFGQASVL
jgi:hypothetical protein